MNALGYSLVWLVMQVTALGLLGTAIYLLARRRGPALRSAIALGTLTLMAVALPLSLSPWPTWWRMELAEAPHPAAEAPAPQAHQPAPQDSSGTVDGAASAVSKATEPKSKIAPQSTASIFWSNFRRTIVEQRATAAQPTWGWPAFMAMMFAAGVTLSIARLFWGLAHLVRQRRQSVVLDDPQLLDELAVLCARVRWARPIELRESAHASAPAVIGFRRSAIVLPPQWREWSLTERRAVLAHELAHVMRGDCWACALAQFSAAVHFYHPLAHWLVQRLRLEQELAADAAGVEYCGGRDTYLVALARLALQQDDRRLAWAARPFLPTRGTFMRRLEMLRDRSAILRARPSRLAAGVALGALVLATVGIIGVRGPLSGTQSTALAAPGDDAKKDQLKIDDKKGTAIPAPKPLQYVPLTALALFSFQPAAVDLSPLPADAIQDMEKQLGISFKQVDRVSTWLTPGKNVPGQPQGLPPQPIQGLMIHSTKPEEYQAILEKMVGTAVPAEFAGKKYFRGTAPHPGGPDAFYRPDPHTVVIDSEMNLNLLLAGGKPPEWDADIERMGDPQMLAVADMQKLGPMLDVDLQHGPGGAQVAAFSPLWQKTERVIVGMDTGTKLKVNIAAICKSPEDAQQVQDTAGALITLASNMLRQSEAQLANAPPQAQAMAKLMSEIANQALKSARLSRSENRVSLRLEAASNTPTMVGLLLPAIQGARMAARQTQSMNNMKQIALAMHNYADVNKHFPPAVLLGPDGKTPYSWRVAILPYIEQDALYKQYKFNEPWDSQANRLVMAKTPVIYRHPNDSNNNVNSSYFVFTGPETVYGTKNGATFADITDGTSNTIMAVEAKRDIPWTKPEDIPYAADAKLPELGGYSPGTFTAAMMDGSVRAFPLTIGETILRALITKAGGEVIPFDEIDKQSGQAPQPPTNTGAPAPVETRKR